MEEFPQKIPNVEFLGKSMQIKLENQKEKDHVQEDNIQHQENNNIGIQGKQSCPPLFSNNKIYWSFSNVFQKNFQ